MICRFCGRMIDKKTRMFHYKNCKARPKIKPKEE